MYNRASEENIVILLAFTGYYIALGFILMGIIWTGHCMSTCVHIGIPVQVKLVFARLINVVHVPC